MTSQALKQAFERAETIKQGHYLRLSGRHADCYVQCARLFEDADTAQLIGRALAERSQNWGADLVLSAAMGGILPGFETARALGLRSVYCEKRSGALVLRRGFVLPEGARVLIIEDEVYTGQSVMEMREIVGALHARVAGIACIVDKSGGTIPFTEPFAALKTIQAHSYPASACPLCEQNVPLENAG